MTIFDIDSLLLQNSNAKNINLKIQLKVFNIVYIELYIKISDIWYCQIGFTSDSKEDIVGKEAEILVKYGYYDQETSVHGIITEQKIMIPGTENTNLYTHLITVKMPLFVCSGSQKNRVFTNKTIKDIIKQVLSASKMKLNINLRVDAVTSICQYNETDLDFFYKICSKMGIFYFHDFDNNCVIISDDFNMFKKKKLKRMIC